MNRLWLHHFGQGLVATPNDFGWQSEPPSHPELLDWLALRLIENGWKLKPMHKLILASATWRQTSQFSPDKAEKDLENRLLWRFLPRRLDGEVIRDSLLSVSGMLDDTMYGKGSLDERSRRRSIYFMIKRSKLIPVMQLFDAPEPLVSQGRRMNTTIAPQALMLMNSPSTCAMQRTLPVSWQRRRVMTWREWWSRATKRSWVANPMRRNCPPPSNFSSCRKVPTPKPNWVIRVSLP